MTSTRETEGEGRSAVVIRAVGRQRKEHDERAKRLAALEAEIAADERALSELRAALAQATKEADTDE